MQHATNQVAKICTQAVVCSSSFYKPAQANSL
uniref:Uncharacterized protein n=1 Tax=Arundo donax TaxID=35708 RepID=A0A0A9CC56_ARUDO